MENYFYIMPLINKAEDVGCVFKVVKSVHYDSTIVRIDTVTSPNVLTDVQNFYSSSYNNLLMVVSIFLVIMVALIGIKMWRDYEEIKTFKFQITNFERKIEQLAEKVKRFETLKLSYTEHIIQMWLNLGRLKEREGDNHFAYICFMNVLDLLGRDFHKEDYYTVKCGNVIKNLKDNACYKRIVGECSVLDEIESIKRVIDKLKDDPEEKETVKDLQNLIQSRLAHPQVDAEISEKKYRSPWEEIRALWMRIMKKTGK